MWHFGWMVQVPGADQGGMKTINILENQRKSLPYGRGRKSVTPPWIPNGFVVIATFRRPAIWHHFMDLEGYRESVFSQFSFHEAFREILENSILAPARFGDPPQLQTPHNINFRNSGNFKKMQSKLYTNKINSPTYEICFNHNRESRSVKVSTFIHLSSIIDFLTVQLTSADTLQFTTDLPPFSFS